MRVKRKRTDILKSELISFSELCEILGVVRKTLFSHQTRYTLFPAIIRPGKKAKEYHREICTTIYEYFEVEVNKEIARKRCAQNVKELKAYKSTIAGLKKQAKQKNWLLIVDGEIFDYSGK